MRTIFLIGILWALIVIATKRNDQTAIDAAFEMGNKAKNILTELKNESFQDTKPSSMEEVNEAPLEVEAPLIRQAIKPIENAQSKTLKKLVEKKKSTEIKDGTALIEQKKDGESSKAKNPSLIIPKPNEIAIPVMPAIPRTVVEKSNIGEGDPFELANIGPTPVSAGKSYDLVKDYYENASRLLEEIK